VLLTWNPRRRSALRPGIDCEGRPLAVNDEGWGYLGTDGNWALKSDFPGATRFTGGRALIERDSSTGRWELIDTEGKTVGQATFGMPGMFE
jgi:hypothetical protein